MKNTHTHTVCRYSRVHAITLNIHVCWEVLKELAKEGLAEIAVAQSYYSIFGFVYDVGGAVNGRLKGGIECERFSCWFVVS